MSLKAKVLWMRLRAGRKQNCFRCLQSFCQEGTSGESNGMMGIRKRFFVHDLKYAHSDLNLVPRYGHDPGHCGTFVIFPFFGFLISATFFSVSVINTVNNENNNNNNNNNENMNMNENVNSKRKRSIATSSHQRNKIKIDLCPDKTRNQCFLTSEMLSFIDNMNNKNGTNIYID